MALVPDLDLRFQSFGVTINAAAPAPVPLPAAGAGLLAALGALGGMRLRRRTA